MILILYLFFLFLIIVLFHKGGSYKALRILDLCLAAFLYVNFVVLATYNNDWDGYESDYNTFRELSDIGWNTAVAISRNIGLSYVQYYMIVQSFIGLCFLYAVYYFYGKEYTLVIVFILLFLMPNSSILIRNYFAFSVFLLSLIAYCKSNRIVAAVLGAVSFTIHSGIIMLFPLFFFKRIVAKYEQRLPKLIRYCLIISVALLLLQTLLFSILESVGLSLFSVYKDDISTIQSAAFMLLLYFGVFTYAIVLSRWILRMYNNLNKKYLIMTSASMYSLLFIGLSRIQIIYFRLYEPLLLISFISILEFQYNCYRSSRLPKVNSFPFNFINNITLILIVVFMAFHKYYLLGLFTGGSEWLSHYTDIILSNEHNILFYTFK